MSFGVLLLLLLGTQPTATLPERSDDRDASARFEAQRTAVAPRVDGLLDEAVWQTARPFSAFHQSFPEPGTPPSERTEVRILYDDANLYVGIRCFDSQPSAIRALLGRRDDMPVSDVVRVMIDSLRHRRDGYVFAVGAGGTLEDARITQDTKIDRAWDGIWEGTSALNADGWSAEMRIPLKLLRFPQVEEQQWGFHVRREIARTHEVLDSVPLSRQTNALASRFADLHSLRQLKPPWQVTLLPYLATRAIGQSGQTGGSGLLAPSADVGLDLLATLTSDLSLAMTVNPDFGQVEADQLLYNLNRVEPFFPEKRPFFLDGLELFESAVVDSDLPQHTLVYSRRIGLDLPLLTAAKLSGNVHDRVRVAVLDAVVAGAEDPSQRAAFDAGQDPGTVPRDTSLRFHPWRPLHLAPTYTLPARVAAPSNFLAGVMRGRLSDAATVGGAVALATPLQPDCNPEDLSATGDASGCTARGGRAATLELSMRSPSGDYTLAAQLSGSQVTGGPSAGRLLPDGTLLRDKDMGFGLLLSGGKLGGEPWRLRFGYGHASPRLDLNPTGFQPLQNEQIALLNPEYVRIDWHGLPEVAVGVLATQRWSTDARVEPLGSRMSLRGRLTLPNSMNAQCDLGIQVARQDLREVVGAGVAFQRSAYAASECTLATDPTQPISATVTGYLDRLLEVPENTRNSSQYLWAETAWQPMPRLRTALSASYSGIMDGPRWMSSDASTHSFGDLVPRFLTLTLRQLVVLSPTLTLQAYAQLFSGYGTYDNFYVASAEPGARLRFADLQPAVSVSNPGFHVGALNINLVLRWEYALGSTLFLVYARSQDEASLPIGQPVPRTLLPVGFNGGLHTESLLLKVAYAL